MASKAIEEKETGGRSGNEEKPASRMAALGGISGWLALTRSGGANRKRVARRRQLAALRA
jgi:hypothetical protein